MAAGTRRYDAVIPAPFGGLGVIVDGEALREIDLLKRVTPASRPRRGFAAEVYRQLAAYLRDARFEFDLPIAPQGTAFQRRVWRALTKIPAGRPVSYGELASGLGSGPRAVGAACRANPTPVVVPCHRVVAKAGLGGFMGATQGPELNIKQWLLAHEQR
jgi:methylated-DNA-[protein]-cysteine S-methyltransferase